MTKLELAQKVIKRVRDLYRMIPEYRDVVDTRAHINFSEATDGSLNLDSIQFSYWDSIYVSPKGMVFVPEHGQRRKLMEYDSFEAFLRQTGGLE